MKLLVTPFQNNLFYSKGKPNESKIAYCTIIAISSVSKSESNQRDQTLEKRGRKGLAEGEGVKCEP